MGAVMSKNRMQKLNYSEGHVLASVGESTFLTVLLSPHMRQIVNLLDIEVKKTERLASVFIHDDEESESGHAVVEQTYRRDWSKDMAIARKEVLAGMSTSSVRNGGGNLLEDE